MKKVVAVIIIFGFLLGTASFCQGAGLASPGILPDSPFYFFDTLWEKISMVFTFNAEKRVEKAMRFAEEKLAEAKVMAEQNKIHAMNKANQRYQELLGLAGQKVVREKEIPRVVEKIPQTVEVIPEIKEEVLPTVEKIPESVKEKPEIQLPVEEKATEEKRVEEKIVEYTGTLNNTTFVKSYRFYHNNHGWSIWPTRDNDYIFAGWVLVGSQEDAFISRVNQQGNLLWTKLIGGAAYDAGYLVTQTKDGFYLLAGQTNGYVGDAEAEITESVIDVFLSKFDQQGNCLWTETVGDLAGDAPVGLYPTNDNGFLLLLASEELNAGAGTEVGGDTDHYFALAKFDANGRKQWIKKTNLNIGGTMGDKEQINFSFEQEDDGGFTLVGMLPFDEVSKTEDEEIASHMPCIIKLDKNFNTQWAKTIEAIPTEYLIAEPDDEKGYIERYMKTRTAAGNFYSVQRTPDNGYLAVGFILPSVEGYANYNPDYETIASTSFLAVKLDKDGEYQWAKTIDTGLFSLDKEFKITRTKNNDFIIMQNIMSAGAKYQASDMTKHIALMKVDSQFNVKWLKTIGPKSKPIAGGAGAPYEFTGSDIRVGNDHGIIIAGTHGTDVVCFVSFGEKFYCYDALLVKLDKNGNLNDNSARLVSSRASVSQKDLSQYITVSDLNPKIINYEMGIKKQKPIVSTKAARTTTALSLFKGKDVVLEEQGFISFLPVSKIAPVAKTRGAMLYESTESVELVNDKSRQVHNELLPILNQLFDNKVKVRDNFGGISLDYIFGRLVTRDDVVATQKHLEGIGYAVDTSEGGQLIMTKIGRTLSMIFSVKSKLHGTLNLTF